MNWRQVLTFEPQESDPTQWVRASYQASVLAQALLPRNWQDYSIDDIDREKGARYARKQVKDAMAEAHTPDIKIEDVQFEECDSSNLSHAGVYYGVTIIGPRAQIVKLLKQENDVEEDELNTYPI